MTPIPVAVPVANGHKSHPKTETVTRTVKTLLNRLPHDKPLEASCGVSIRGFHFVRITGVSRGVTWRVDIYRCRMFVVSASTRNGFKTGALTSVLTYLQAAMA